jgi:hypothetical protein
MNWERIESARARARFMLAIPWLVLAFLVLLPTSEPSFGPTLLLRFSGIQQSRGATSIPIDAIPLAVGAFGMLIGFAWMWRIYRAPTRIEGATWRSHED